MAVEPETKALVDRLRSGRAWHLPKDVASRRVPLLGRDPRARRRTRAVAPRASRATGAPRDRSRIRWRQDALPRGARDARRGGRWSRDRHASGPSRSRSSSERDSESRAGRVGRRPGVAGANPGALAALAAQASEWAERFPQRSVAANPWTLDAAVAEVLRVTTAEQTASSGLRRRAVDRSDVI